MNNTLPRNVDLYTTGKFACYARSRSVAGSLGHMIEAVQPAGDMSDPPVSDLVLVQCLSPDLDHHCDFGAGRFAGVVGQGSLFLVPPKTFADTHLRVPHAIRFFSFGADRLRPHVDAARQVQDPFDFGRLHAGAFRDPFIEAALNRLWSQRDHDASTDRLFADATMLSVVAALCRLVDPPQKISKGGLTPRQLVLVEDYLAANLADDVCLTDLAVLVGLSPAHFSRAFKTAVGEPPHRHLMRRRVERAQTLLAGTQMSVTEIAHTCGFSSSQHMATVFRRAVGLTPVTYRQQRSS